MNMIHEYDSWIEVPIDTNALIDAAKKFQNVKFSFKMITVQTYLDPSVVPNKESSHITVVASNVVSDIGHNKVENFIRKYDDRFALDFGKVKSTISRLEFVFPMLRYRSRFGSIKPICLRFQ